MAGKTYDGPVVFRDGVHYAVDGDGHADLDRPLRWVEGATYRAAEDGEPLHNDVHELNGVEVVFGDDDAIVVSEEEANEVRKMLEARRGENA